MKRKIAMPLRPLFFDIPAVLQLLKVFMKVHMMIHYCGYKDLLMFTLFAKFERKCLTNIDLRHVKRSY